MSPFKFVPISAWVLAAVPARAAEYAVEAALAALVLGAGWVLWRRLGRQQAELRASEERWRTLFEHAGVAMIEEDFTAVMPRLAALRAAGVADLRAHLNAQPALAIELFRLLRVSAANRAALTLLGGGDLAGMNAGIRAFVPTVPSEAFLEKVTAIWEQRLAVTLETGLTGLDGVRHFGLMQCAVPTAAGRPDFSRVLVAFTDLTALRASEERYRALFDGAVEGVFETLPAGGFRRLNRALARMLGYDSPEDLLAMKPEAFQGFYVQPGRRGEFLACLGEGSAFTDFESEVRRRDGSTIWISENVRAVRDGAGRLEYLQGFVTDITARKRAEVALRESEQRYRLLFEQAPVAIVEFDHTRLQEWFEQLRAAGVTDLAAHLAAQPELRDQVLALAPLSSINEAGVRIFGAASKEELVRRLGEIMTPEAVAMRLHNVLVRWRGGNQTEGEIPLHVLGGGTRQFFYRWWMPPVDGRPGRLRSQTVMVDITEVRAAERALAAERERLRVTLGAMSEGVITVDPGGVIRFINDAACELTGWPAEGAAGRTIDEVCALRHAKTGAVVIAPVASVLVSDRVMDLPPQTTVLRKQGGSVLVEGRCAPMHDTAGRGIGAVVVLRDVTERSQLEVDLLRASKLESVGLLAGGIAHDFNNILAVIMGNLTLAQLDAGLSQNAVRWLTEAERGALRARDLTQQLLTFAKGGEPVRSAVRLAEVVREAAEFALHGSAARCEFSINDDLWPADADKGQIGQVVQNLIINAAQAMPGGGVIRVTLGNQQVGKGAVGPLAAGRYLSLAIADCGTGIAPEHLARIFEPYFTTKQEGTGLGLATVYSIIKKHRGHVTVESEVGRGTTFHIWLPAARAEPAAPVPSRSPFDPIHGRILFMDDEEGIREMAGMLLKRLGLEPTTVADGAAAVREYEAARAAGRPYDVVMVDLTVPGGMGGLQAMRELLKLDPQVRAIVSSGYSSDPVLANHRVHGFRGVVPKPFRVGDLADTLRAVLAQA
jgi:PAS domain S-box-containing protein